LALCNYKLFLNDYRGYILAGFSLVFLANVYMSLLALLRQAIKKEKVEIEKIESQTDIETSLDSKKV
jgi:hypothetical protein